MSVGKVRDFDIKNGNWSAYVDRLEMYFVANKIAEDLKLPTLIALIGEPAYELLSTLASPRKPSTLKYKEAVELLQAHLQPKPSILAERYRFRQRRQSAGETIADYVADLKKMSRYCEFKINLEENLRDQFVCGLRSEYIRQRLFAEDNIDYQKALVLANTLEAAERDAGAVEGTQEQTTSRELSERIHKLELNKCSACGVNGHGAHNCRYKEFECSYCGQPGHLRRVCRKKEFDRRIKSTISNRGNNGARGRSRRGRVIGSSAYGAGVWRSGNMARGGRSNARTARSNDVIDAAYWLSEPAMDDNSGSEQDVEGTNEEPIHDNLFDGTLGKYTGEEVKLCVRDGTEPVFCRARPVPYALLARVNAELDAMLRAGVIEPVERSDWATPLVIARKGDGGIRLCADYKVTLNKALLVDSTEVLTHFDISLESIVTCDASARGLGAVLAQRASDGSERVVAYASRALTAAELHYSQIHKEALAIIFAVDKFHQYLYGRKFTLRTDHKPLVTIFGPHAGIPNTAASRLQRWAIKLSAYDFNIEYIRSDKNTADILSRLISTHKEGVISEELDTPEQTYLHFAAEALLLDYQTLKKETVSDSVLSRVARYINDGWPVEVEMKELKPYFNRRKELYIELGCVMWGHRLVIPSTCRNKVIAELHESHMGIVKTKSLARSYVWWPGIDEALEAACCSCTVCAEVADAPPAHAPRAWPWPDRPWTRIHVDFLGPVAGLTYLVVVDAHSKWIEAIRMLSTTSQAVIKELREMWARFGLPKQLVSDNGPPFFSGEFQQFLNNNGIEHIFSAPYHPASNGAAENAVKICKKSIKKAIKSKSDVHSTLCRFLLAYRNTPHYTTGESPAKMLLGRNLRMRLDCLKPDQKALIRARQETVEATSSGVTRQFNPGDLVWFREYRSSNKWSAGTVIEKTGSTDYNVKSIHGTEVHRHIDQLKPRVINRTARLVDANFRNFQPVQPVKSSRSSLVFPSDNNRAPNTEQDRTNGTSLTKALVEETSRTQTDGSDLVTSEPLSTSSVPLNMPKVQETGSPRVPITRDIRTSNRTRKPVKRYGFDDD
ncbi:uncharacterized protein K02A2.6-like [Trichoplusia ni]|uniref:RNA-directed DNA polymerase n=1 Tax=Trichoplusia ni TaxID=7111 RepID=A0A7E5WTR5_TRINI|nr:uncharacterized protein K02A2.6-like [Trichoplusia ni]